MLTRAEDQRSDVRQIFAKVIRAAGSRLVTFADRIAQTRREVNRSEHDAGAAIFAIEPNSRTHDKSYSEEASDEFVRFAELERLYGRPS
jgi:hypothetical protein